MYILDVQWFKEITQGRNPTIQRDASGFVAIDSTKIWKNWSDTFVLAKSCEQVYKYSINSHINGVLYVCVYIENIVKFSMFQLVCNLKII